jgi:hypothetical protein
MIFPSLIIINQWLSWAIQEKHGTPWKTHDCPLKDPSHQGQDRPSIRWITADCRNLAEIADDSFPLVVARPPKPNFIVVGWCCNVYYVYDCVCIIMYAYFINYIIYIIIYIYNYIYIIIYIYCIYIIIYIIIIYICVCVCVLCCRMQHSIHMMFQCMTWHDLTWHDMTYMLHVCYLNTLVISYKL